MILVNLKLERDVVNLSTSPSHCIYCILCFRLTGNTDSDSDAAQHCRFTFTGIMSHQTLSSSQSSGGPNLRKRRQTASDESYHPANSPSGAQSANPDESPKKRKKLATSLAPDTENRVILAYNKAAGKPQDLISRCYINEISSEDHHIQFSHVIASATSREDASKAIFSTPTQQ